jgi:hypothetical protein
LATACWDFIVAKSIAEEPRQCLFGDRCASPTENLYTFYQQAMEAIFMPAQGILAGPLLACRSRAAADWRTGNQR